MNDQEKLEKSEKDLKKSVTDKELAELELININTTILQLMDSISELRMKIKYSS